MSQDIVREAYFFGCCILTGVIVVAAYDLLRIFRRVIPHGTAAVGAEDLLYWIACSIFIFRMLYMCYDGIIRGFAIAAIVLGMLLYNRSVSSMVVKYISFVLNKMVWTVTAPLKWAANFFGKILKKCAKTVRLVINRNKSESG